MPLSSLPHPNLYLMNQFLGLASLGAGRKNIYTVDREREGEEAGDRPGQRNVTIGYVVAQRGGGQAARAGDQKRICFIYMKVILRHVLQPFWRRASKFDQVNIIYTEYS